MEIFDWKLRDNWPLFLGESEVEDCEIEDNLVEEFYNSFSHIRVYHTCRPLDPHLYLKEGLRLADYSELLNQFIVNVKKYCDIELQNEHVISAKKEIGTFHENRVFVVLDDQNIIDQAGHYAIYGSEYLVAVAVHIQSKFGFFGKNYLKKFGTPTVYEILLEIDDISERELKELVCSVNNSIFHEESSESIDFTFELYEAIEAEKIISLYHPQKIKDPLERDLVYVHKNC